VCGVHALNSVMCGVHMHKRVCTMCTHIIMAHMVCVVLVERKGVWLVHAQYEYKLSRDSVVNGARRLLVHGRVY
jgi:hypothetical protein